MGFPQQADILCMAQSVQTSASQIFSNKFQQLGNSVKPSQNSNYLIKPY